MRQYIFRYHGIVLSPRWPDVMHHWSQYTSDCFSFQMTLPCWLVQQTNIICDWKTIPSQEYPFTIKVDWINMKQKYFAQQHYKLLGLGIKLII